MADDSMSASAPLKTEDTPPNETLYVKNLNDKIKHDRMKDSLYSAFSQHGKILEITVGRCRRLRGQAWITFDDITSASNALRATNGTIIFEKPAGVHFAKEKADIIAQREGTFVPREKRKREKVKPETAPKPKKPNKNDSNGAKHEGAPPPPPPQQNAPNKILFLQELPESCNQEMLNVLFKQYHGFKEVRMVPGKASLAFVEFEDEAQASIALQGLHGFKLTPTDALQVSFAKK